MQYSTCFGISKTEPLKTKRMKTERKARWLRLSNRLLSGVLLLLGFDSCDSMGIGMDTPCEYGMPYVTFELKGKVTDTQQNPIAGTRVIVKGIESEYNRVYSFDTIQTDASGSYQWKEEHMPLIYKMRVVCQDPTGTYLADSTDIAIEPKGDKQGWCMGSDSHEVNFHLKEK